MGNNSLSNTEKSLRSIAKRYENVKYSVGLAVHFLIQIQFKHQKNKKIL